MALTRTGEDTYLGQDWIFEDLRFERDQAGTVTGMRISAEGVRDLLFEKQK